MGKERSSRGSSPVVWELEGCGHGDEFVHGGGGRTWGRAGRRRCCRAVQADSLEERREREVVELMGSSVGHGGRRSGGAGGGLLS